MVERRRAVYRVELGPAGGVEVQMRTRSGERFHGLLRDLSIAGAGATCMVESAPALAIADTVHLTFTDASLGDPIGVEATVTSRTDGERSRRYEFAFQASPEAGDRNAARFFALFNRRSAVRVDTGDERVEVVMHPYTALDEAANASARSRPGARGVLDDISAGGLAVRAEPGSDKVLGDYDAVQAELELPGGARPLALVAAIRVRRLVEGALHYGLEFDRERSAGFDAQQSAIMDYVMRRQREELQRRVEVA